MPMGVVSPGTVSVKKNIFSLFDYMRANNAVSAIPRSIEHYLVPIDFTDVRFGSEPDVRYRPTADLQRYLELELRLTSLQRFGFGFLKFSFLKNRML